VKYVCALTVTPPSSTVSPLLTNTELNITSSTIGKTRRKTTARRLRATLTSW
jgi:hypothetical protein